MSSRSVQDSGMFLCRVVRSCCCVVDAFGGLVDRSAGLNGGCELRLSLSLSLFLSLSFSFSCFSILFSSLLVYVRGGTFRLVRFALLG